jgi:uncharacterized protein
MRFLPYGISAKTVGRNDVPMPNAATLNAIYRYPIKGLSPQPYQRVLLRTGQTLPNDRRYAIENGPSGFDPSAPKWLAKSHFLMLMRNERLAALQTHFDDDTTTLTIRHHGREVASGNLETTAGRGAIEQYLTDYCADDLKGSPKILTAPPHSFSDVAKKVVSIINLASVTAIESLVGNAVNPLRFRANLYVAGWPAWTEFDLLGKTLAIGGARLKVFKRIVRCAATNVDPVTAARDLNIPETLQRRLGHADCGIYAEVIGDGEIAIGDAITELAPAAAP